jgi:aromatic-L-amino-acid/L-tryptophan decarboxylase
MEQRSELNGSLDPQDWSAMRALGHQMIDDMMDYLQHIGQQPVWRAIPPEVKASFGSAIPQEPSDIADIYQEFKTNILPYTKGNIHPRFFAWVQGTGTPLGVLAELLAAAMNPNVAIGEHAAMYVDQQVINWSKQMMNYPATATGILVSGASMANITALAVARNHQLALPVRKGGVRAVDGQMLLYCSTETHSCVQKAAEVLGLGTGAVRKIGVMPDYRINIAELIYTIEQDLAQGAVPFCVVGNAGTVNTAAIDPLDELAAVCRKYQLWFHVDGAFGALAKLVPRYAAPLQAIEQADSVAFDLHKWMYMPYEVACTLIKNGQAHRDSFSVTPSYLMQAQRGLAGGPDPVNNFGLELSRGFKALKVWMSLKEHGLKKYAEMIEKNIAQSFYLGELAEQETDLELLTPVTLNIVCYRFVKNGLSEAALTELNQEILIQLQEQGIASPSSTWLGGRFAIRVCNVNQRTQQADLDLLVRETVRLGRALLMS